MIKAALFILGLLMMGSAFAQHEHHKPAAKNTAHHAMEKDTTLHDQQLHKGHDMENMSQAFSLNLPMN